MVHTTAFIYHPDYLKYQFGPTHPFKSIRGELTLDLLKKLGIFDKKAKHFKPKPAKESELLLVHTKNYVDFVKKMSKKGEGFLDYGDTPATKGLYEGACSRVGGSLLAGDLVMKGKALHAFNPGGGLHHAKADSAAGFCVFNDIAILIRYLQKKYKLKRIAVIDIDGHHGDGTQQIFYQEPILKISLHRYGFGFYPGSGNINEIGEMEGEGFSVNIPLPAGTGDKSYLYAFSQIIPDLIRKYKPEILINQFGADGHFQDPLVGLSLTTKAYQQIASILHKLAHEVCDGRYIILGGGGYVPENVARCWAIAFIEISEAISKADLYRELFDKVERRESEAVVKEVRETVRALRELISLAPADSRSSRDNQRCGKPPKRMR